MGRKCFVFALLRPSFHGRKRGDAEGLKSLSPFMLESSPFFLCASILPNDELSIIFNI